MSDKQTKNPARKVSVLGQPQHEAIQQTFAETEAKLTDPVVVPVDPEEGWDVDEHQAEKEDVQNG